MEGNGILIEGNNLSYWNTHSIFTNNSVDDKPVYYHTDKNNSTVSSNSGQVILANCENMIIEDLELSTNAVGIQLGFSSNNDILTNEIVNGFYGVRLVNSHKNNISYNNIRSNSQSAILLDSSNDNYIIGNDILSNLEDGIHLLHSDENTISNNAVKDNEYHGLHISESNRNHFEKNEIKYNSGYGVSISNSNGNKGVDNTLSSNDWGGIILSESGDITLEENEMKEDGVIIWGDLLEHWDSHSIHTSNTVNEKPLYYWVGEDNQSIPSDAGQVILVDSENIEISDLNISDGSAGIQLGFSSNNDLTSSVSSGNDWSGIVLKESDNNIITDNVISRNGGFGIHLFASDNNAIGRNIAESNIDSGSSLVSSSSNLINNNTFSNNNPGLSLDVDSSDNIIYHNNFKNNLVQAEDYGVNQWNNDLPSGGNFWSDYEDEYPDAEKRSRGDIWENPYKGEGFVDDYPLTEPTQTEDEADEEDGIWSLIILAPPIILILILTLYWRKDDEDSEDDKVAEEDEGLE